jgi:hypothetical protein
VHVGSLQERFLSAQANHSLGNEWEEKALACFARNDDARIRRYTGIAFFRQLPEGVAGAYRLFVNLLSALRQ